MPRTIPSNTDSVIDSRDIIERIEELQAERDTYDEERGEERDPWTAAQPDDAAELAALEKLAKECEEYAEDWNVGTTLIRHSYFTEYARELVEDCGYISPELPHWIEIDWTATAENVRADYTSVDFDGALYWVR